MVGIGASAGGLEALTQLFHNLSDDTGLGFVVVQHLDPHHESQLAELLAMHTRMPVVQALDGTSVEPNHVYVIPPNAGISIRDCKLLLSARPESRSQYLPIDDFLCSLAEDQRNRSVGVILSGNGSDGTIGIEAIKSEGGITFAQDGSAKFESMPRQAAAAGVVDFVLSPQAIGVELASLANHVKSGKSRTDELIPNGPVLQRIFLILREQCGLDFSNYKKSTVQRRLERRMALRQTGSLEEYLERLEQDQSERQLLYNDLLITVTEFFRDVPAFQALQEKGFGRIVKNRNPENPIRIWVAACSTGKEVYSIAMCLIEYLQRIGRNHRLQLFGTDISERAIESARSGKYPESIAATVSPERLRQFFTKVDGGYLVSRSVREMCVFSRHDLTRDPPLSKMDLVSCRNLLIYLGPVLQQRVMAVLSYSVKPAGLLLLGSSETLGSASDYFQVLDSRNKLYLRNQEVSTGLLGFPISSPGVPARTRSSTTARVDDATALDRLADREILEEYAPVGFLLNAQWQVVKFRGDAGAYLGTPEGNPTLDVLTLVRKDVVEPLRTALEEAAATDMLARRDRIRIRSQQDVIEASLLVRPLSEPGMDRHFLVLFEKISQRERRMAESGGDASRESDLALELASTRSYMQGLVEELRSANEEAQSSNEELQSTNEELQTAKEELQSSNEELTTTNEEMQSRNRELSQLNNDLGNLLGSLDMPILMLDSDLRIRRYTPVRDSVFRLIPSDLGRPISDLRVGIDLPDLDEIMRGVVHSSEPFQRDVRGTDNHWYSLRIRPYRTTEGRIEGAVLQLLDIDPLKRTLEEVARARDYSDAILATVREPLLVLDRDLRVQTANESFYETFGEAGRASIGRLVYELDEGRWNAPKIHQMLDRLLSSSSEQARDVEIEQTLEGAGTRTFQLNARRIGEPSGVFRILMALDDITDRKRAAEAKYRRLFETAKDGMLIADAESGDITDVNPFALKLFDAERGSIVGKTFWTLPGLEGRLAEGERLLERLRNSDVIRFPEIEIPGKRDGCVVEIVANSYWEEERPLIQFNVRDITERKRFERQLQQTAKLESLGVLAGGIAHDFNNLLTGIMGNASLALSDGPAGSLYQDSLREVLRSSSRAADLTRQMLAYAGKGSFVIRTVDLSELVRETSILIRSSIPKPVSVNLNLGRDLPPIEADSSQIQQLIMNLVINGAESIRKSRNGAVRVSTRAEQFDPTSFQLTFAAEGIRAGVFVTLEVADNGSGMGPEVLARIFDPFYTTKFTGRGLGLAAVQGIIRSHGGALMVQSVDGEGTTFRVFIPASGHSKVEPRATFAPGDLKGSGLVLVAEDDESVQALAKAALQKHGYTVITACNGEDAVRIAQKRAEELDLVLLDLSMPVMGGEEAASRIRKIRPDLRVVLCSGYDTSRVMERVEANSVQAFLAKPYTVEELLKTVKDALK